MDLDNCNEKYNVEIQSDYEILFLVMRSKKKNVGSDNKRFGVDR